MAAVVGRRWPSHIPFSQVKVAGGQPHVRDGFECAFRPGDFKLKADRGAEGTKVAAEVKYFEFVCPRTGKYCGMIRVGLDKPSSPPASWKWDGDFDHPTLIPSINCLAHEEGKPENKYAGCGWHGHVRRGVFEG